MQETVIDIKGNKQQVTGSSYIFVQESPYTPQDDANPYDNPDDFMFTRMTVEKAKSTNPNYLSWPYFIGVVEGDRPTKDLQENMLLNRLAAQLTYMCKGVSNQKGSGFVKSQIFHHLNLSEMQPLIKQLTIPKKMQEIAEQISSDIKRKAFHDSNMKVTEESLAGKNWTSEINSAFQGRRDMIDRNSIRLKDEYGEEFELDVQAYICVQEDPAFVKTTCMQVIDVMDKNEDLLHWPYIVRVGGRSSGGSVDEKRLFDFGRDASRCAVVCQLDESFRKEKSSKLSSMSGEDVREMIGSLDEGVEKYQYQNLFVAKQNQLGYRFLLALQSLPLENRKHILKKELEICVRRADDDPEFNPFNGDDVKVYAEKVMIYLDEVRGEGKSSPSRKVALLKLKEKFLQAQ